MGDEPRLAGLGFAIDLIEMSAIFGVWPVLSLHSGRGAFHAAALSMDEPHLSRPAWITIGCGAASGCATCPAGSQCGHLPLFHPHVAAIPAMIRRSLSSRSPPLGAGKTICDVFNSLRRGGGREVGAHLG
jgi:hypothetical protein